MICSVGVCVVFIECVCVCVRVQEFHCVCYALCKYQYAYTHLCGGVAGVVLCVATRH